MVRKYTDEIREILDSEFVEIIKVKLFSVRYGEDNEIPISDFTDDFKIFIQSGIFVNSVVWKLDTDIEEIIPECDMYIRGEIDGEKEVLVYIRLIEEKIFLNWLGKLDKWLFTT